MSASDKLVEVRDALIADADVLVAEGTTDSFVAAETKLEEVRALDAKIKTATEVEARAAAVADAKSKAGVSSVGGAVITKESRTYDRDERNSWSLDLFKAQVRNDQGAWDRLRRHATEDAIESRAGSTTATAGGEFTPPAYLLSDYAQFARAKRVTANLLTNRSLAEGISSIKIPQITTGTKVALQGGNNATATTRDMVTAYVTSSVETAAGYNDVSVQLLEQSPINMDGIIVGDLMADYALAINTAVVGNTAGTSNTLKGLIYDGINSGNSITWTETTPTVANFIVAAGKALSGVANNRFDNAEAMVMSPSTWYYLSSLVDSTNRPIFAQAGTGFNPAFTAAASLGQTQGLVGFYGAGVPVYVDATIPKTVNTSQAPIIIAKFSDSYLFESAQKAGIFPDVGSANLTVRYRLYGYVSLAHRFDKAISVITGTGTAVQSGF